MQIFKLGDILIIINNFVVDIQSRDVTESKRIRELLKPALTWQRHT